MSRCLVYTYWLSIEFDHVHDLNGIVSIFLTQEFNKAITLVLASDSILWHVGVDHGPCLEKEFPQQWFTNLLIEAPHVHSGIWRGSQRLGKGCEYDRKGGDKNTKMESRQENWEWGGGVKKENRKLD